MWQHAFLDLSKQVIKSCSGTQKSIATKSYKNHIRTFFLAFQNGSLKAVPKPPKKAPWKTCFKLIFKKKNCFWCYKTDINYLFLNGEKIPLEDHRKIMWEEGKMFFFAFQNEPLKAVPEPLKNARLKTSLQLQYF